MVLPSNACMLKHSTNDAAHFQISWDREMELENYKVALTEMSYHRDDLTLNRGSIFSIIYEQTTSQMYIFPIKSMREMLRKRWFAGVQIYKITRGKNIRIRLSHPERQFQLTLTDADDIQNMGFTRVKKLRWKAVHDYISNEYFLETRNNFNIRALIKKTSYY